MGSALAAEARDCGFTSYRWLSFLLGHNHKRVAPIKKPRESDHGEPECRVRLAWFRFALLEQSELPTKKEDFSEQSRARQKKTPEQSDQLCILRKPWSPEREDFATCPYLFTVEWIGRLEMAIESASAPREIFQLKITLLGVNPPIWRRVLVPRDLTLAQLHTVLQTVMGWENYHLHEFHIGGLTIGYPRVAPQGVSVDILRHTIG
jgi:Plasmid pRiA4b ORF-3-like protein